MAKWLRKCPKCKEPLEATMKLYLSDVVIESESGRVTSYTVGISGIDLSPMTQRETLEDYIHNSFVNPIVQGAEGDELDIYCVNSHRISLNGDLLSTDADDNAKPFLPDLPKKQIRNRRRLRHAIAGVAREGAEGDE